METRIDDRGFSNILVILLDISANIENQVHLSTLLTPWIFFWVSISRDCILESLVSQFSGKKIKISTSSFLNSETKYYKNTLKHREY